ncbi:membrane protease YdiL (CAAX protease family) [Pedobacter sp. UYEF25]
MKKLFPNTLLQILFLFSVGLMLCLPFYYIIKTFYSNWSPDSTATVIYVLLLCFYISLVFFVNRKRQIAVAITWNWLSWSIICLIFFAIIGFRFGFEFPILKLLSTKPTLPVPELMSFAIILGALLLAPLLEEVLFRGMILKGLLTNIQYGRSYFQLLFSRLYIQTFPRWAVPFF